MLVDARGSSASNINDTTISPKSKNEQRDNNRGREDRTEDDIDKRPESAQKSFRIRKYSRSLSRSS